MRGRAIDVRKSAVLLIAAVVLTGCDDIEAAPAAPSEGTTKTKATPSKAPATPTPSPTHRKLKPGAKGPDVKVLQQRLKALHYDPGKADGRYGPSTQTAVWAFQAVNRLKQKSTLSASFWKALDAPKEPRPVAKKRERNRVDVDLKRQYLVLYKDGRPRLITHVSSGSGEYYCAKDRGATVARCRYATTGTGDFRTGRRASGWETSPLGQLYNPIYFNGGIAFHGALDVPLHPASHGCVRMPMHIAEYFPDLVGTGVPVHVRRAR